MTQEFKDTLLRYLTGNLEEQSGDNTPYFQPTIEITNNLYQYMMDNFNVTGERAPYIINIIKGNQNDNYLCYGRGYNFGFIIILDSNFNIIQSTKNYTSGTQMNEFLMLVQNANGGFYGIDYNSSNNTYRFIMLNNMLIKTINQSEYKFVMQKTYNITSNYPSNFKLVNILKNPNGSDYFIYGSRLVNSYARPCAIEYKINVGSSNEWVQYDYTSSDSIGYNVTGGWASWDGESNIDFMLIGGSNSPTNTKVYLYEKNETSIDLNNTYDTNIDTSAIGQFDVLELKTVILSKINAYVVAYVDSLNPKFYVFRINNSSINKIYESNTYSGILGQFNKFDITTDYINTYFWYLVPYGSYYNFYAGLIVNNNVYEALITNTNVYPLTIQCSFNQYNLYSLTLQAGNKLYKVPFIFNQYNYNGTDYENVNSLVPSNVILFDDDVQNSQMVFARNLYNLNINGNTTISTLEVPNTFLNDTSILNKTLIGQTNLDLDYDLTQITKNIYENLYINFFNTIIMKNDNTANEIINYEGASRLNNSVSNETDYLNAQATKIRINYQDNTSLIQNITPPTIDDDVATYTFSIYVPKLIDNIEIISFDENTSYQTINGTFNINKYYIITQDVRVE